MGEADVPLYEHTVGKCLMGGDLSRAQSIRGRPRENMGFT